MKYIDRNLVIGIIWILVAGILFYNKKFGIGIIWLYVGILNLRTFLRNRKIVLEIDRLEAVLDSTEIELSNEVHNIYNEYIGYGYAVNKAFKPEKSHAAEIELMCTYVQDVGYGEMGLGPYIAVQNDDEVYCAVEEYQEGKTFEGAITVEPAEGMFLFKAKREYHSDMMYFYGFALDDEDAFWDKAGLCLVYSKKYVGTEAEEKLMRVLDEAANSFCKRSFDF